MFAKHKFIYILNGFFYGLRMPMGVTFFQSFSKPSSLFVFYRKDKFYAVRIRNILIGVQPKPSLLRFAINNRDIPCKSLV